MMAKYIPTPEKRREESRRYYLKHRAEILRKADEWRRNNREKANEASLRYYFEHRAEAAQRRAECNRNNRERAREVARRFYRRHREEILERTAKYTRSHPEQQKRWRTTLKGQVSRQCGYAARRARKLGVTGSYFTVADVVLLLARQEEKCALCKNPFPPVGTLRRFDIDHIVPLGRGSNGRENIQLLCQKCNKRKGNRAV